mmetsp:Transcript_2398/g.10169  ORF Transcript_2398/g.10169 Transcript_2398/m.10169 type:complete len:106 (-) Transcript_2398:1231-1548(-)
MNLVLRAPQNETLNPQRRTSAPLQGAHELVEALESFAFRSFNSRTIPFTCSNPQTPIIEVSSSLLSTTEASSRIASSDSYRYTSLSWITTFRKDAMAEMTTPSSV